MPSSPKNILCTRQIDPKWTTQALRHNIHITTSDFIAIQPVISSDIAADVNRLSGVKDAVTVFTSKNAVHILAENYLNDTPVHWRIYCLEGSTEQAVSKYFPASLIAATARYSHELADRIIEQAKGTVHFFCGDLRREELPEKLNQHGRTLKEYVVYRTILKPAKVQEAYDGILFFSPSAANSFFSVNHLPAGTVCFAIGETTAAAVRSHTGNKVIVSRKMDTAKMIAEVQDYFDDTDSVL